MYSPSTAVLASADLSWSVVRSGFAPSRIAAAPATCGVAIDVPLIATYEPSPPLSPERAAVMSPPGPMTLGLSAPERESGPWLVKYDMWPDGSSTEPTVKACSAEPGAPMVSAAPALPAATTNSEPVSAVIWLSASAMRSLPSDGCDDPRLIETIGAFWPAHSIASMIQESWPKPSAPSTLPTRRLAPSATPRCVPSDAAPLPAMVEATCVP